MRYFPAVFMFTAALAVHLSIYFFGLSSGKGNLVDPDAYMRMVQAEEILIDKTRNWGDHYYSRDNAPFGYQTHWSNSVDVLIALLYFPLLLILEPGSALWGAGILLSPLLLLPCLLAIDSLCRIRLPLEGRMLAMLFFLVQPGIFNYFLAARPDHHSLILTCFIVSLCALTHIILAHSGIKMYLMISIALSISFWTSIESLVGWAAVSLALTIVWLFRPEEAKNIAIFQSLTCVLSTLLLLIETPSLALSAGEPDRLNASHLLLLFCISVSWWILSTIQAKNLNRCIVGILLAAGSIGVTLLAFPSLIGGPFGAVDQELKELWLNHVTELHPFGSHALSYLINALAWLPAIFPALAYFIYLGFKQPLTFKNHQLVILCWLALAALMTGLTVYQKRWVAYADLIWMGPAVAGIWQLLSYLENKPFFRLQRAIILITLCAGPALLSAALSIPSDNSVEPSSSSQKKHSTLEWQISEYSMPLFLSQQSEINHPKSTILAFIDLGPEILYRTEASIIASPYHRNHDGILDAHTVLNCEDESIAQTILEQRNVSWIVVGITETEASYYDGENSLYSRILAETLPPWLSIEHRVCASDGQYFICKVELP